MSASPARRRILAPEVVQTSAMDCGPASLKCLLEGFGVGVSYGRLREACQTSVDGTSIDTMEDVAGKLGLDAEQIMIPADHVLLPSARALPAIVVVRLPGGDTHFVVVWSVVAGRVQVMDPGVGRRFLRPRELFDELFIHRLPVPAAAFREHAGTAEFLDPLGERLAALGVRGRALVDRGLADPEVHTLAALDAAARLVESIAAAGGVDRGAPAARLIEALLDAELARPRPEPGVPDDDAPIPAGFWTARPAPPDEDGPRVALRGAVLVRVKGVRGDRATSLADLPPELSLALTEPPARPGLAVWRMLREDGLLAPAALFFALALVTAGALVEALLLRGTFEIALLLGPLRQRLGAAIALLVLAGLLLAAEVPIRALVSGIGRRLEARLRIAFLRKIPRLADRYFQSRASSDMVHRSHAVHALRAVPDVAAELTRAVLALLVTTAALIWLDPGGAPAALSVAALSLAVPLAVSGAVTERDLRVRTHGAALGRHYLDALLGLVPLRTHGAERALRREHDAVLADWARAGLDLLRAATRAETLQAVIGFACAGALVAGHLSRAADPSRALLLLYWALSLPAYGEQIASAARRYPALRNTALRLFEPLGAIEEVAEVDGARALIEGDAAAVEMRDLRVVAAGRTILDGVDLHLAPGEHVAVVGPSGAGKSSLVGLLLGWHRPAAGALLIDGAPLEGDRLASLRRGTVWVDPEVHLWNRALHDNLRYGSDGPGAPMARVIEAADLRHVLEILPEGFASSLGEGGSLLSGGEGQRVRFGRAVHRQGVRLAILDEPFRGLDRGRRRELLARARRLWEGVTLITITHDVEETRSFPRVLVLDGGRVVEDGAPADLAREGTRFQALLDAEQAVRRGLWEGGGLRRLDLVAGRIQGDPGGPR